MLAIPSFSKCLSIMLFKWGCFAHAWFMVPLGFLLGGIRKGPAARSHWAGTGQVYKGKLVSNIAIESIRCSALWRIYDIPDEPSIGQYEPTVFWIYEKFGWYAAVYYQLAFRNVGHGWLHLFAQRKADNGDTPQDNRLRKKFGLSYGLRPYVDWRAGGDAMATSRDPIALAGYYFVPTIIF